MTPDMPNKESVWAQALQDADTAIQADRRMREFAWEQYKRGVQDTIDALRSGIAGMGDASVPKMDILKFCEFTEERQREKLPPDFPAAVN